MVAMISGRTGFVCKQSSPEFSILVLCGTELTGTCVESMTIVGRVPALNSGDFDTGAGEASSLGLADVQAAKLMIAKAVISLIEDIWQNL